MPGLYAYGVSVLTPIHFRAPGVNSLWWPNICIFLDKVGTDQSRGILSPFMGTACLKVDRIPQFSSNLPDILLDVHSGSVQNTCVLEISIFAYNFLWILCYKNMSNWELLRFLAILSKSAQYRTRNFVYSTLWVLLGVRYMVTVNHIFGAFFGPTMDQNVGFQLFWRSFFWIHM